jgi:hypothetical protein
MTPERRFCPCPCCLTVIQTNRWACSFCIRWHPDRIPKRPVLVKENPTP